MQDAKLFHKYVRLSQLSIEGSKNIYSFLSATCSNIRPETNFRDAFLTGCLCQNTNMKLSKPSTGGPNRLFCTQEKFFLYLWCRLGVDYSTDTGYGHCDTWIRRSSNPPTSSTELRCLPCRQCNICAWEEHPFKRGEREVEDSICWHVWLSRGPYWCMDNVFDKCSNMVYITAIMIHDEELLL